MEPQVIYHLTTLSAWEHAQDNGVYEAPSLATEGFIHCSTEEQLEGVMNRHFEQHENLVKLVIDPKRLLHPLRYERSTSMNDAYPHIHGPLNLEAVTQIVFLDAISSED